MTRHDVVALNTSTRSENAMHHDDVARRYGFRGGLVAGVDVWAYLTQPAAQRWGADWVTRGRMQARFLVPVYDGETIVVTGTDTTLADGRDGLVLDATNAAGERCATGTAWLPEEVGPPPDPSRWPVVAQPAPGDRPPPGPESLPEGAALGLAPHTFTVADATGYLADVRETLPLYAEAGIAHPAWLLRDANYVLAGAVRLGPWIHVESDVTHLGLVNDGQEITCRALVNREWEHKGHRFVELDVLHLADGRPVQRTTHTAIHTPRPPAAA